MKRSQIMLVSEQSSLNSIVEYECLLGPSISRVKELLIISILKLVVHHEGRKWQKRKNVMNRRKTSTWYFITCHKLSNKCMDIMRRG
jgi:hypothetical protein